MFSIGQHVIHPGQGVCTVVGFRDDTPQPMLLLETKQGHAQTILMYPWRRPTVCTPPSLSKMPSTC